MATVKICGISNHDEDRKLTLNNGDIVVSLVNDRAIGHYLVTSYRGYSREPYQQRPKDIKSYCALINLATGYPAFEEPCSRNTTLKRVLSHLYDRLAINSNQASRDIMQLKSKEYELTITPVEEEADYGTD